VGNLRHILFLTGEYPVTKLCPSAHQSRRTTTGLTKSVMKQILLLSVLSSASLAQQDADTIIQRSVAANEADWKATHEYDYVERDRQKGGGTKTSEELMVLERESDHLLMEELTKALDFKLVGEQKLGPYEVYVLKATPRPGYEPPNNETKVLTGMEGKLWIDEKTFQWVKVEATVIRPVSIEGFLAEVEPGTHFELEKTPVTDSIWLPKHFAMKSQAKVLFLFTRTSQADEVYYGYHKPTPITAIGPKR
jgi:hypothetical protein